MEYRQSCQEISRVQEAGTTSKASLLVSREGKNFVITVATPAYLDRLRQYNQRFSEDNQLDDLAYPLDPIPTTEEELCDHLALISSEVLNPYLIEQVVKSSDNS